MEKTAVDMSVKKLFALVGRATKPVAKRLSRGLGYLLGVAGGLTAGEYLGEMKKERKIREAGPDINEATLKMMLGLAALTLIGGYGMSRLMRRRGESKSPAAFVASSELATPGGLIRDPNYPYFR